MSECSLLEKTTDMSVLQTHCQYLHCADTLNALGEW